MSKVKGQKPIRISVDLQPSYYELLKDMQNLTEAESHSTVLREALKRYFKEVVGDDKVLLKKYNHIL